MASAVMSSSVMPSAKYSCDGVAREIGQGYDGEGVDLRERGWRETGGLRKAKSERGGDEAESGDGGERS